MQLSPTSAFFEALHIGNSSEMHGRLPTNLVGKSNKVKMPELRDHWDFSSSVDGLDNGETFQSV